MATTNDLLKDVYANFLSAYKHGSGSKYTDVISFEAIGVSPGLSTTAPNSASLAVEGVSHEVDMLPDITTGVYTPTMRTVSVTYENMLNVSAPVLESGAETFNSLKASAKEAFQNSALGSQLGPSNFQPAFATPVDWYDDTKQANWTSYSFQASPATPPPTVPVIYHPPIRVIQRMPPWQLRTNVAPPVVHAGAPPIVHATAPPSVGHLHPAAVPAPPHGVIGGPGLRQFHPIPIVHVGPISGGHVPVAPAPPVKPVVVTTTPPTPAAHPVLQPTFSMSFQYCIVHCFRPWLSGDFLATQNWYVPGAKAGDYSSGPAAAPSQGSGTGNASPATDSSSSEGDVYEGGPFAYIPVAFIAIKNLVLNTAAIDGGGSGQPATAFGPFSLANASGNSNALSAPGVQIIAWICNAQPILPPATDPALVPPSTADQVVSGVDTAVSILGSLFGKH